jgi:outer membrane protein assembly factor BamB
MLDSSGSLRTYGFSSVMAGKVLVAMDVSLFGYDGQSGNLLWTFAPPLRIQDISVLGGDDTGVYAATAGGHVYAIDPTSGQQRWHAVVADSPAVAYNPFPSEGSFYGGFTVFVSTSADSGGVFALDAGTGANRWTFYFPRPSAQVPARGWIRPAVAGSILIAGTESGVYALSRQTGAVRWSGLPADLQTKGVGAVAARGNRVFVGFNTGAVVALDLESGRELWRNQTIPVTVRQLSADDVNLYVTFAGQFAALHASDGSLAWKPGGDVGVLASTMDQDRVFLAGSSGFYAFSK